MSRLPAVSTVLGLSLLLWGASSRVVSAFPGPDPYIPQTTTDDFVCISGEVAESDAGEPLGGVGICVFPEGIPADSSVSPGTIYEAEIQYPLPPMPRLRWVDHTDAKGRFAICRIPSWLAKRGFRVIVYKPGYVPEFAQQVASGPGGDPSYDLSFLLTPSEP